jgi:3-oxoadipate enol-lactonase
MAGAARSWRWTRGRVARDGEDIYWELIDAAAGDDHRPVVVLSHGAGGSHAAWYQQVPALAPRYRVLTWDSRGFGNSTNRADAPGAEAAAADLAAVLDPLGIERAHLVGQSMGGWHISAFAVAHPGRVLSLTYADTVGGLWTPELRHAFQQFQTGGGLTGGADEVVTLGGHRALWSGTAERDPAHAFLYQQLGSFFDPPMRRLGDTIAWTVSHDDIAALAVPVLFIAGVHDHIFPAALLAASAARIPGARYAEIAAAGHSPYFEQPGPWNQALLDFLP